MNSGNEKPLAIDALPARTRRKALMDRLAEPHRYDVAVIGGGATGLGVALDAAARGFSVVLIESHDFAKGSSSRSTKLVHGGVRYLAQGNLALVRQGLHERSTLLANAPHLAQPLAFVMPAYKFWEKSLYGLGLKAYDALAGKDALGASRSLDAAATLQCLPTLQDRHLRGGIQYWDGQFDDARLALALARTAARQGALLVNYCAATGLLHENGKVSGVCVKDRETGHALELHAQCVVNATGVWVDGLRMHDAQATGGQARPMVAPSQGVHVVVERDFLAADQALLVPRTSDGRVLFAVPWLGKVILGTTDTPCQGLAREPLALRAEVDFILRESARYLCRPPGLSDIKSLWVGLRPLLKPADDEAKNTASLSREHAVLIGQSGLVTVTGGKWTTYRAMASDVLEKCVAAGLLAQRTGMPTDHLRLVGAQASSVALSAPPGLHLYGSEAAAVQALPGAGRELAPGLSEAMVRFAARHEYARTVEDVLARRSRLLFLDAALARAVAPAVAALLQQENGMDARLASFLALCDQYLKVPD